MRYSWKKLYVAVAALLISSAFSVIASAQSAYELRLGMYESAVKLVVGQDLGNLDPELSDEKEQWYRKGDLYLVFCNHKLFAFRIALNPSVAAWANAVDGIRKEKGEPEINLQSAIIGSVTAKWRLAPYQSLSISMAQVSSGALVVDRWMQDSRKCDTPAVL